MNPRSPYLQSFSLGGLSFQIRGRARYILISTLTDERTLFLISADGLVNMTALEELLPWRSLVLIFS